MPPRSLSQFSVDTHLFRELGELLVGRDSTAVVELIKNAYDADATEVVVTGVDLDDPERGSIVIRDNGNGMRPRTFQRGFLRIASRTKEVGDRRSRRFLRRFTGAKGIGRLAAHKLAREVSIRSVPWRPGVAAARVGIDATLDWDRIEQFETVADIVGEEAVRADRICYDAESESGTTIVLRRLRRAWKAEERERFMNEVQTFAPPRVMVQPLPRSAVPKSLLFREPVVRDASGGDPDWEIRLEGEFEPGESYWQELVDSSGWIIEIDARADREVVTYCIAPTLRTRQDHPDAEVHRHNVPHPDSLNGPWFHARIFVREGRRWDRQVNGPRVYMEGFRVLPYGEARNDWLGLDFDSTTRSRELSRLGEQTGLGTRVRDEGLNMLPARQYFGGVFLTQRDAPSLRMLVNREGFVPEHGYESLVNLVRLGIDLSTRARSAATQTVRDLRRETRRVPRGEPAATPILTAEAAFRNSVKSVEELARAARQDLALGNIPSAENLVQTLTTSVDALQQETDGLLQERAMVRVLASLGLHRAAFVHEIRGLLGMAEAIEAGLGAIRAERSLPQEIRRRIAAMQQSTADLRRGLERQASYLTEIITPDARRRRSRLYLADRFEAAMRLTALAAERAAVTIDNKIPKDVRIPRPMFPAELVVVFSNLLTNALKAAGKGGHILAEAWLEPDGGVSVRLANTGVVVRPKESERWFRPFESTTTEVSTALGQGMGLGLPITRSLLEEYGASIRFVRAPEGFATAVQITFPPEL